MAHIYEKGQLVIPKYFRDLLGWGKNTRVSFEVDNNRLIVQRQKSIDLELEEFAMEKDVGPIPLDTDKLLGELEEAERKKYKKMGIGY